MALVAYSTMESKDLNKLYEKRVMALPLHLTYEQAADLLSCSKAQIQRGIREGDLKVGKTPGGKSKRSKRILTSSVLDWIRKYIDKV
ncbi:MAG: helix-turn-helix domain-containing protein [Planctomycetes bacterium]|jgi:excisionase family DNA binding protein|nr:helix-turn-helix domain-containing protein [Planctomycetota bacterium]MBT5120631.1 helix-turn-helix domain-containing protein [Planctomycetota bacterium]